MYMYICTYISIYICIHICIYTHTHTHTHTHVKLYVRMYVCTFFVYAKICVCIMHKCIKYLFLADLKASRQAGGREAVGIDGGAHELAMIRAQVCVCVCVRARARVCV
jgi:hypothetical protein